jgi:hypothetical protein
MWEVSVTDIVVDVLRALGSHSSAQDVFSYGRDILGAEWAYGDVLSELEDMMAEGRLRELVAA